MDIIILILEMVLFIGLSALFSGLNVALMAISLPDVMRRAKLGDKDAQTVLPLRKNLHLTLAAILIGNVACITASSIVLEPHFEGLMAVVLSTLLIVIFGEIIPQAFFAQRATHMVARFSIFIKIVIGLTYVLAKPLQLLLDTLVGGEEHRLHSRSELGLLIAEHDNSDVSELDDDEIDIIRGALQLSQKRVADIMVPIERTFWLAYDAVLDMATVDRIKAAGFSRIPIFDKRHTHCFGVILMKDMVDIDFDTKPVPVRAFRLHPTKTVGARTALDTLIKKFGTIHTQLMAVEKGDSIVGVVSIEDVVEEIIGQEIQDETDFTHDRQ